MMAHFIVQLDWAMECLGMVKYPRCCCSGVFRSDENCSIFLLLCILEQGLTDGFNWLVKGNPELLTLLLYLRVLGLHECATTTTPGLCSAGGRTQGFLRAK